MHSFDQTYLKLPYLFHQVCYIYFVALKDKANGVQKLYRKRGKLLIVITFSGSGIYVKFPVEIDPIDSQSIDDEESEEESSESIDDEQSEGKSGEWRKWHNSVIGTLLQYIDDKCGLVVPVLIVAYTKMCRGISFRSDGRVPTHMLMSLGRGHNASTIVQTLGRSTFNGKQILNANGFDSVTVLATANDYTMCHKMQAYIDTIYERIQLGDTFAEAVTGAVSCFTSIRLVPDINNNLQLKNLPLHYS